MAELYCPRCGEGLRAVACQCRGQIISAEAWKLGRWDWRPVFGSFSNGVRPMDIDFIVERNGQFLVYETKAPGVEIGTGQRLALQRLAALPQFTVATIWGEPDEPERIQHCTNGQWGSPQPFSSGDLWNHSADWWLRVNRQRRTA